MRRQGGAASTAAASFDAVVDAYDAFATHKDESGFFLECLSDRRHAALDVGSGTGVMASELARFYDMVVGIDISEPMLERARERRSAPNVEYLSMDAAELDLDERFDLIVSRNTFHHIDDVPAVLDRMLDHLAPGGRIAIMDCVNHERIIDRLPRPPDAMIRVFFWGEALLWYRRDRRSKGAEVARELLRARLCRPWLDHVLTDRYLTRGEFREVYGSVLKGARFYDVDGFYALDWTASSDREL